MIDEKLLGRITANPEIFGGKPIIRGMRISVEMILSLLAQGEESETILADYPVLVQFDVARASCVCLHGRDARATFSNCTTTRFIPNLKSSRLPRVCACGNLP